MRLSKTGCLVSLAAICSVVCMATPPLRVLTQASQGEGPEVIAAKVDKVFLVTDGKYSSITYQIMWHGQEVIVEDAIHSTNYKVGDKIEVLILRHDMSSATEPNGPKVIHFMVFPHTPES